MGTALDKQLKEEAITFLKRVLPEGSTVYAQFMRVSSTGESRVYAVFCTHDGVVYKIDGYIARICGYRRVEGRNQPTGLRSTGYPDQIVQNIAYALYGDENALKCSRWI